LHTELEWSDYLVERIQQVRERENRPIIRAHIGIAADTIEPTIKAIEKLADAGAFEIVSLAPDQTSQELLAKFIRGEEDPNKYLAGQGGAPIRSVEDLQRLKAATQRGNFPMARIYTGTDELVALAQLWEENLNICFPAVPIFFYNELDGREALSAFAIHSMNTTAQLNIGPGSASLWRSTTPTNGVCAMPPMICR
jgi:hypothetical protein